MANTQTSVPLFVANAVLTANQQNLSAGTGVPVFATTVTRDAAFGGSNKALAEGQLAYIEASNIVQYYDGAAWATVGPSSSVDTAIFNETQASATQGGASVATTFTKRTLNTTNINNISGASIASSVISLPAGTYLVSGSSPFYRTNNTKIRLQNTTDSTTAILGTSEFAVSTGDGVCRSLLTGLFTITATKNFEIQYYATTVKTNDGLGIATNIASVSEVYTVIQIQKVA